MPLQTVNIYDKKEDFKPTAEEMRVIADRMKDPEFAKLMHEYMVSLSDPETKREEEEYLKQMEKEAKEGGDYSFDFIFPKPGFVVQLTQTSGYKQNSKVYINVCESDKVDEFREETTNDRWGSNWHVPVAVSQEREEEFEGAPVVVYDAVFHPKTRALADRSDRFLCFLVEIAVEHINGGYKKTFGFEFRRLSSSTPSIGKPHNQTVRKEKGKSAFPTSTEPVSKAPVKPNVAPAAAINDQRSAKTDKQSTAGQSTTAPAAPSAPAVSSANLPVHSILHKGEIDMLDAWQWKIVDKRVGIPKEIVVKMEFPGVASAAALDIHIGGAYLDIVKNPKHNFHGCLPLPFTVDETPVSAKFDKTKQVLVLTLKVIPPTRPADAITPEQMVAEQRGEERQPETTVAESQPIVAAPQVEEVKTQGKPEPRALDTHETGSRHVDPMPAVEPVAVCPSAEASTPSQPSKPVDVLPSPETPEVQASHIAGDRASQLMASLAAARKEREAAEEAERLVEEAAAAARKQDAQAPVVPTAVEEQPEVIDLRNKQNEWMASIKKQQDEQERARVAAEEEAQRLADEETRKQQKEARRKIEAQKEEERLESLFKQKMQELPLKNRYIFDIE